MKLNFGSLPRNDAEIVLTFLQKLRGVKIGRGETLIVPHNVIDVVTIGALCQVFNAHPDMTSGVLRITRGFRVHSVHTIPAPITKQLIVELDIEYESEIGQPDPATSSAPSPTSDEADSRRMGRTPTSPTSLKSTQVGGDHYSKMKIQPIDFIIANGIGYIEGNIIKYVCRYKSKNGVEDLKKAQHYLQMLIEQEEKTNGK